MDDELITFINARLDEDQGAAYALGGTTWTAKRLGDHDYEIHVTHDPLIHAVAPTGGIADVQREDVAEHIAYCDPRRALREVTAKRAILAMADETEGYAYSVAVDRAITHLATTWSNHPDYQERWKP